MRVLESSLLSFIIFNYKLMSRTFIIIIRDTFLGILIIILYFLQLQAYVKNIYNYHSRCASWNPHYYPLLSLIILWFTSDFFVARSNNDLSYLSKLLCQDNLVLSNHIYTQLIDIDFSSYVDVITITDTSSEVKIQYFEKNKG